MHRQAWRSLLKSPAYIATAILTLGLGIGLTTAAFSLLNGFVLRPLPFPDPDRLVDVHELSATELCAGCGVGTSLPIFEEWKRDARAFTSLEAANERPFSISGGDHASERIGGALVTAGLFPLLGTQPVTGRMFLPEDDRAGAPPVAIVSHALWQTRMMGAALSGQTIRINGVDHTVVGVMPPGFGFPEFARVWTPLRANTAEWAPDDRSLGAYGRLRDDVSIVQARDEMTAIARGISERYPATHKAWTAGVTRMRDDLAGEEAQLFWLVVGMVFVVLLIACVNLAGVGLARAAARERELAVRAAIGARGGDLVRLLLLESLWLAAGGGVLGTLFALWGADLARMLLPETLPFWLTFDVDWRVFAFCGLVTIAAGLASGILPAWRAGRPNVLPALRQGAGASPDGRRLRSWLVGAELALALVLLVSAGLLTKTFARTLAFEPGYDMTGLLAGDVGLRATRYDEPEAMVRFTQALASRLSTTPGIHGVAFSHSQFLAGFGTVDRTIETDDGPLQPGYSPRFASAITPAYFPTFGLQIRQGRNFDDTDRVGSEAVAIINEAMAARSFPGTAALERRLRMPDGTWRRIIGIVQSVEAAPLARRGNPPPYVYVPFFQSPGRPVALHVRSGPRLDAKTAVVNAVALVDPDEPLEDLQPAEAAFWNEVAPARIAAALVGAIAALALLLAAIGLYGVVAYTVGQRTREFGIRLALGATARQVLTLVLGQGVVVTIGGLVVGLVAAAATTRVLDMILFGTDPLDPTVFASSALVLAAVMLVASWLPARKAARVEPLTALRDE